MDDEPPYRITFSHLCRGAENAEDTLRNTAEATLQRRSVPRARINIAVVDDAGIARLNQRHLDHQGPTDVLSFDLSDDSDGDLDGELVVSLDTARREAHRRNHPLEAELALYVAHGVLHLTGCDDATAAAAAAMHEQEDSILESVGLLPVFGKGPMVTGPLGMRGNPSQHSPSEHTRSGQTGHARCRESKSSAPGQRRE